MPVAAPISKAFVPEGQINLLGKVTALVFRFAQSRYPFSGVLSETKLLRAIAELLKTTAPTMTPAINLLVPEN
jgi:hypothetical protein